MDKPFGKFIRSKLFTFHIGPEKVPFVVNSEAIAKQSSALGALVNSNMIEAHSRTVAWPDVDEDTFVRFCEFCYLDDYSPPSCACDIKQPVETGETEASPAAALMIPKPEPELEIALSSTGRSKKGKKKKLGSQKARPLDDWTQFSEEEKKSDNLPSDEDYPFPEMKGKELDNLLRDKDYPLPERCSRFTEQFKPFSNVTEDQDFSPVFLGHARLYVIADKYCIETLKDLVLYKLYTTLKGFTLFKKRVGDLIKLIRFIYHDGNTRGQTKVLDPLRKLVTLYAATKLNDIALDALFLETLEDGGEFVVDFWKLNWQKRARLPWAGL
ncbi:hypothetical protein MaudCBS49596_002260 [Microsporum audouinii]